MISIQKVNPGRTVLSLMLLMVIACLSQHAAADSKVPESVVALLPASVQLKTQNWGVFETEFGKVISGQMGGLFTGAVTCDYTIGPEFNLEFGGDSGWEASPEQLEMWEQMNKPDFEAVGESMSSKISVHVSPTSGKRNVGAPKYVQLPNGHATYVEFTWKCDKNPDGQNVMLEGYTHRGATALKFWFWANGGSAEAIAMASEIFTKFDNLDIAELYK